MPLEQVKILNDNEGEVRVLHSDNNIETVSVEIKRVWGNFVELQNALPEDLMLIIE